MTSVEPAATTAIACSDLVVRYGSTQAVDHLNLEVAPGTVCALLGPNGAGKTSTVECLEGYRRPTSGTVSVLGLDPRRDQARLTPRIGVMLQRGGVYPTMTPRQVLRLFSRYYDRPDDPDRLLGELGLDRVAKTPWRRLSGGEQQRLSLALALVGRPDVAFLDEPTAGVDPEGRIVVRHAIEALRHRGVAVLLTSHELGEVERVADEVVVIRAGAPLFRGSLASLRRGSGDRFGFQAGAGLATAELTEVLGLAPSALVETEPGSYVVAGEPLPDRIAALTAWLARHGHGLAQLRTERSLEEAYLDLLAVDDPAAAPEHRDDASAAAGEATARGVEAS